MTELQERPTKKLAELKAYLERKVAEHEEEIRTLRSFLEIVDTLLAERSYRKMEIPQSMGGAGPLPSQGRGTSSQSIRTMAGVHLADIFVEGSELRIVPSQSIRFDINAAPLKTFLIGKVLEPMKEGDVEAVKKQQLAPEKVLSFEVDQEANRLKELRVTNFGDERRLNEIRNGVRWALRKIYERTIGTAS